MTTNPFSLSSAFATAFALLCVWWAMGTNDKPTQAIITLFGAAFAVKSLERMEDKR